MLQKWEKGNLLSVSHPFIEAQGRSGTVHKKLKRVVVRGQVLPVHSNQSDDGTGKKVPFNICKGGGRKGGGGDQILVLNNVNV